MEISLILIILLIEKYVFDVKQVHEINREQLATIQDPFKIKR